MRRHRMLWVAGFALLAALFVAAAGTTVMLLWNWLLPSIAGLRAIGFWEATGLLVLARILVGGLRGRGHWHWRHRWHGRWANMTPEEREKFHEGMKTRCGWRHHHGEESSPPASSAR
jgi:hypothetical protein